MRNRVKSETGRERDRETKRVSCYYYYNYCYYHYIILQVLHQLTRFRKIVSINFKLVFPASTFHIEIERILCFCTRMQFIRHPFPIGSYV